MVSHQVATATSYVGLAGPLDRDHVQAVEPAEAPVGLLLLARHGERDVEAVAGGELARVLDDDAHPAGELEVLQQERDLQGAGYRTAAVRSTLRSARFSLGRGRRVGPYPAPPPAAPVRIAFVGQETYFRAAALTTPDP